MWQFCTVVCVWVFKEHSLYLALHLHTDEGTSDRPSWCSRWDILTFTWEKKPPWCNIDHSQRCHWSSILLSEPQDTLPNCFACCLPLCVTYTPTLTRENQRSAPFDARTTQGNLKPSSTHGRCSESPCKTSSSSHKWSSPTAGYTHPCWRRSLPGRSYLGLGKGRREREKERERDATGEKHSQATLRATSEP